MQDATFRSRNCIRTNYVGRAYCNLIEQLALHCRDKVLVTLQRIDGNLWFVYDIPGYPRGTCYKRFMRGISSLDKEVEELMMWGVQARYRI